MDFSSVLPPELTWVIFSLLDPPSLRAGCNTCKNWKRLIDKKICWQKVYHNLLQAKGIFSGLKDDSFPIKKVVLSLRPFPSIEKAALSIKNYKSFCVYLGKGVYQENLKFTAPVYIKGYTPSHPFFKKDQHRSLPILRPVNISSSLTPTTTLSPINFESTEGEIRNVRIESNCECVRIKKGLLSIIDCELTAIDGKQENNSDSAVPVSVAEANERRYKPNYLVIIQGNGQGILKGNSIFDGSVGIYYSGASLVATGNTIRNIRWGTVVSAKEALIEANDVFDCQDGLIVQTGGSAHASSNKFHHNQRGASVLNESEISLDGNQIYNNVMRGISVQDSGKAKIVRNHIFKNGVRGLSIQSDGSASVKENQIYENKFGVLIVNSGKAELFGNHIFKNTERGVHLQDQASGSLKNTSVFDNAGMGVLALGQSKLIMENNSIHSNGQSGIGLEKEAYGIVKNNKIFQNKWGASLLMDSNMELINNEIYSNIIRGISVQDCSHAKIHTTNIYNNKEGIAVTQSARAEITSSTIHNNQNNGLFLQHQSSTLLDKCKLFQNLRGVTILNRSVATLNDNEIFDNALCAISIRDTSEASMSNNKFWGNKEEVEKSMHFHAINNSITTGFCTFSVTGKTFVEQNWYHCMSCFPNDFHSGVCEVCVHKCHAGHDVSRNPKYSSFYCDCGAGETDCGTRNKFECKCLAGKDATSSGLTNSNSSYPPNASVLSGSAESSHPTSQANNPFSIATSNTTAFNPGSFPNNSLLSEVTGTFSSHNFHPAAPSSSLNSRLFNTPPHNHNLSLNLPHQNVNTPPKINDSLSASLFLSELNNRQKEASSSSLSTSPSAVTSTTALIPNSLTPPTSGTSTFLNSLNHAQTPSSSSSSMGFSHTSMSPLHTFSSPISSSMQPHPLSVPSILTTMPSSTSTHGINGGQVHQENGVYHLPGDQQNRLKTSSSSTSPSSSLSSSLSSSSSSSSPPASHSASSSSSTLAANNNHNLSHDHNPPPSSSPPSGSVLSAVEDQHNSLDPMMEDSFSVENLSSNKNGGRHLMTNNQSTTDLDHPRSATSTTSSNHLNEEDPSVEGMLIETTSGHHHNLMPSKAALPMPTMSNSPAVNNTPSISTNSRNGTSPNPSSWMEGNHR